MLHSEAINALREVAAVDVPLAWSSRCGPLAISGGGAGWSDDHGGQYHDDIIAQSRDGFQGHVAGALDGSIGVLFEQNGSDEPDEGVVVGEDAHLGSAFDLAVDAFRDPLVEWIFDQ